jgi:salicylate synthetase
MPCLREFNLPVPPTPHQAAAALMRGGALRGDFFLYASRHQIRLAGDWQATVTVAADSVSVEHNGRTTAAKTERDPLAQAGRLLAALPLTDWSAYGYFAFDLARFYLPSYRWSYGGPLLRLSVPRLEVVLRGNRVQIRCADDPDRVADLLRGAAAAAALAVSPTPVAITNGDHNCFCSRVAALVAAIKANKLEKAILSRRLNFPGRLDLLGTYDAAAHANPAARSFCFRAGAVAAVGFSPEVLLKSDGRGHIVTNPLAATRPRGSSPADDARLRAELFQDAKEVKEHAISVLLAQEEMGSVCRPKSVRVSHFMGVKRFRFVQHLSSYVGGNLAAGRNVWDAIRAVFPGVTVSGIPKPEALQWIGDLEEEPRGVYAGAVGFVDSRGAADLALPIRTVFQYGDSFQLAAGAGIVAESVPEREYLESAMKMNTMAGQVVLAAGPAA